MATDNPAAETGGIRPSARPAAPRATGCYQLDFRLSSHIFMMIYGSRHPSTPATSFRAARHTLPSHHGSSLSSSASLF
ncbi:hypothetical protein [Streptomyces armeniacus]|uniref:hypothetical protein n=1 Tax=Streptomyces armeniacus TaxID=83291 RepID=UPI001AD7F5A2|nr:hypothetical protein [Streptomyces armeniacus]